MVGYVFSPAVSCAEDGMYFKEFNLQVWNLFLKNN